jgi:hypothetical protein
MRDNPWHLQLPVAEHYQWFKNLVDLHEITTAWLKEIQSDHPPHTLTRGLSPDVTRNFWMLDSLSKIDLEHLVEDSSAEDMLSRLEQTVWIVQAWTLHDLKSRAPQGDEQTALESVLEQICWNLGRKCSETRWKSLPMLGNQSLKEILSSLYDSPFAGYPHQDGFLIKRATEEQILIELKCCPHQSPYAEIKNEVDSLCQFHTAWMRGYAFSLNNRIRVEKLSGKTRCVQKWTFG